MPVYEIDEKLTTKSAREEIFAAGGYKSLQKEPIDSFAASLILESWLHNTHHQQFPRLNQIGPSSLSFPRGGKERATGVY